MSQQEDMVTQDAGHDEETGSYVAVSPAADMAEDAAGEGLADADSEPGEGDEDRGVQRINRADRRRRKQGRNDRLER